RPKMPDRCCGDLTSGKSWLRDTIYAGSVTELRHPESANKTSRHPNSSPGLSELLLRSLTAALSEVRYQDTGMKDPGIADIANTGLASLKLVYPYRVTGVLFPSRVR